VLAQSSATGAGGALDVKVAGPLTVDSGASLGTKAAGDGNAGSVSVIVAGPVTIDMSVDQGLLDGIGSLTESRGIAGDVTVSARDLTVSNYGAVASISTKEGAGAGRSGKVSVDVSGMLSINGPSGPPQAATGIVGDSEGTGNAGDVTVSAGDLTINNFGQISRF
jgi:hypothetical protein